MNSICEDKKEHFLSSEIGGKPPSEKIVILNDNFDNTFLNCLAKTDKINEMNR